MKSSNLLLTILVAALVSLSFNYFTPKVSNPIASQKETAFERVLRTRTLRCGYVNWKPYYIKDPITGVVSGINYDLMREVGKVLGLKIEWTDEIGWGTIGEGFKAKKYDAVCTSMWPDSGKYMNMSLSIPLFFSEIVAYVRPDDMRFDGQYDRLNKKDVRIAAIDGAFTYHLARENFPEAQIVALPQMVQESEYMMAVPSKKADVIFIDVDETKGYLESNPNQLRPVRNISPVKIFPHVIAFPSGEFQLTQVVNQALQSLIDNGFMDKVKSKYKTEYIVPEKGFSQR